MGDDAPGFDGGNTASYQLGGSINKNWASTNRKFIASVCGNQDPKNQGRG